MIAPITARLVATLVPAKIEGSALGSRTRMNDRSVEAPIDRDSRIISLSIDRNPVMVSTRIGKNAMEKVIRMRGADPYPNQTTNSGASATLGMLLKAIT